MMKSRYLGIASVLLLSASSAALADDLSEDILANQLARTHQEQVKYLAEARIDAEARHIAELKRIQAMRDGQPVYAQPAPIYIQPNYAYPNYYAPATVYYGRVEQPTIIYNYQRNYYRHR